MKFIKSVCFGLVMSLILGGPVSAKSISKETMEDAEYMMRKIVQDIHERKLRASITDVTFDKSIHVVGKAVKFSKAKKDKKTGATFSCARVSLNTKIKVSKGKSEKIRRTDEICKNVKSGAIRYVANVK